MLTLEPTQEPIFHPQPGPAATAPVPRTLPARAPCFVGHADLLDALRRRLTTDHDPALVAVITGPGGVGKSTVAIEAAHELAAEFPDGQLYARMSEHLGGTENTAEVLAQFLRALGFPAGEIPADLDARAALYRGAIVGRRVLAVVEDAVDETQVKPLMPGTRSGRLIVTTRARTAEAPGTAVFELAPLDAPAGIELLTAGIGRRRVSAEPHAAAELVELCGGVPLALYGAMTQLAVRAYWTLDQMVEHLRAGQRLDRLSYRGTDVRATLRRGYGHLPAPARRLFARLGLLATDDWAAWAAAPLLDLDPHAAADALEALVDARMVDVVAGQGGLVRYRLPELARLYARELAVEEPEQERAAAARRLFGAWLHLADEARRRHRADPAGDRLGGAPRWPLDAPVVDATLADPLAWYERERSALLATVRQAAEAGAVEHCWHLAVAVAALAGARHPDDWRASNECALRAAVQAGDRLGEATIRYSLHELDLLTHRHADATRPAGTPRENSTPLSVIVPLRPARLELVASADTGAYTDNTISGRDRVGRRLPRRNPAGSRTVTTTLDAGEAER